MALQLAIAATLLGTTKSLDSLGASVASYDIPPTDANTLVAWLAAQRIAAPPPKAVTRTAVVLVLKAVTEESAPDSRIVDWFAITGGKDSVIGTLFSS